VKAPSELAESFRARGLKVTPQRECIFSLLYRNDVHPSADAIFAAARQQMPTLSLKTVYQTLNDLAEMGEIRHLDLGTGSSRFDPNTDAHHHLVCNRCGRVRDLYADFGVEVPPGQSEGFAVGSAEVVFRGLCAECSKSSNPDLIEENPLPWQI
jgi:Fur family peroxide stress response transcriptional regulator